jgi:hypothetical protein
MAAVPRNCSRTNGFAELALRITMPNDAQAGFNSIILIVNPKLVSSVIVVPCCSPHCFRPMSAAELWYLGKLALTNQKARSRPDADGEDSGRCRSRLRQSICTEFAVSRDSDTRNGWNNVAEVVSHRIIIYILTPACRECAGYNLFYPY